MHGQPGPPEADESTTGGGPPGTPRPQSLMLSFLGNYVLRRDIAVFSGSFIDVFARLGVGEHALRSMLTRMVNRGMLARHRKGRRMYFGLTDLSVRVLEDGERRVWARGVVNTTWDGRWTILTFSLPDSWQSVRHDLRSSLVWAGFGPLGNGTWIAPAQIDVREVIAGLDIDDRIKVFSGVSEPPTDVPAMLRDAYDLDELAARYKVFLDRWDTPSPMPEAPDDLARYLWMVTSWLDLVRRDPRLPAEHLPPEWPALRAETVVADLRARYTAPARVLADQALDVVRVGPPGDEPGE